MGFFKKTLEKKKQIENKYLEHQKAKLKRMKEREKVNRQMDAIKAAKTKRKLHEAKTRQKFQEIKLKEQKQRADSLNAIFGDQKKKDKIRLI